MSEPENSETVIAAMVAPWRFQMRAPCLFSGALVVGLWACSGGPKPGTFSGGKPMPTPTVLAADNVPLMPIEVAGANLTWDCYSAENAATRESGRAELGCRINDAEKKGIEGRADVEKITVHKKDGTPPEVFENGKGLQNLCGADRVCYALFRIANDALAKVEKIVPQFSASVDFMNKKPFVFESTPEFVAEARRGDQALVHWTENPVLARLDNAECTSTSVFQSGQCVMLDEVERFLFEGSDRTENCQTADSLPRGSGCRSLSSRFKLVAAPGKCGAFPSGGVAYLMTPQGCMGIERL